MEGLIIYNSKYGATRQYAEWLGKELKLSVMLPGEVTENQINDADYLLIGTSVYSGKFRIRKWLRKSVKSISNKKLFLFVVNATDPDEQARRNQFVLDNVPAEISQYCEIYFLPGRLIYKNLTFFDKLMVKMAERMMKDPEKRKAIRSDLDAVKKDNLVSLVKAVNDFCYGKNPLSPDSVAHNIESPIHPKNNF